MGIGEWLATRDWAATGGMLTAVFTGFTAIWVVISRPKPTMRIELKDLTHRADNSSVTATYAFRNIGTGRALEVRVFVTMPGLPDKQSSTTISSLAAGEEITLSRVHASRAGAMPLDEETGLYPNIAPDFDAKEMGVAVTWTQPPLIRRTKGLRAQESELLRDYHSRHFPLG